MGDPTNDVSIVSFGIRVLTIDVQVILSKDLGSFVDGITRAVKDSTQHVFGHRQLHARAGKFDMGGFDIDTGCTLKDLDDSLFALYFEYLSATSGTIRESELNDFIIRRKLHR